MERDFQLELNGVILRVRKFGPEVAREAKKDLNEAAGLLVSALKGASPVSDAPHKVRGVMYRPGATKRSMRILPLRRARSATYVGPFLRKSGGAPPPFYVQFVEKGTKRITARRFIERTGETVGPTAQSIAYRLLLRRIDQYEKRNFK